MKVKDILRLSADLRKVDCSAESKRLCERLQLDTARKIDDLSFGNRKKVAIGLRFTASAGTACVGRTDRWT